MTGTLWYFYGASLKEKNTYEDVNEYRHCAFSEVKIMLLPSLESEYWTHNQPFVV